MWRDAVSSCHGDEIVLKRLKKQLANLKCKCKICEKYNVTSTHEDISIPEKSAKGYLHDVKSNHFVTCPGCFVAYSLLKRTDKSFKDVETEVSIVKLSSDKSMQKTVDGLHKTTSMTKKGVTYSESVIADFFDKEMELFQENQKHLNQVKCNNSGGNEESYNCLCLENFIDSIRPPLKY